MTTINGHRDTLLLLRARLLGDVNQMADAALKDTNTVRMPSDMADVGTDAYEQELTLDLLGNEKEVLEQIEAALVRIEDGSYGKCEACGKSIAKARLEATGQPGFRRTSSSSLAFGVLRHLSREFPWLMVRMIKAGGGAGCCWGDRILIM